MTPCVETRPQRGCPRSQVQHGSSGTRRSHAWLQGVAAESSRGRMKKRGGMTTSPSVRAHDATQCFVMNSPSSALNLALTCARQAEALSVPLPLQAAALAESGADAPMSEDEARMAKVRPEGFSWSADRTHACLWTGLFSFSSTRRQDHVPRRTATALRGRR